MQHVPESVIQAPESPDAPEALPGCRSISDDDLCAWCTRLLYRPGEISLCRLS
ncbi:antirestriction protein, partial [Escherichia coli]